MSFPWNPQQQQKSSVNSVNLFWNKSSKKWFKNFGKNFRRKINRKTASKPAVKNYPGFKLCKNGLCRNLKKGNDQVVFGPRGTHPKDYVKRKTADRSTMSCYFSFGGRGDCYVDKRPVEQPVKPVEPVKPLELPVAALNSELLAPNFQLGSSLSDSSNSNSLPIWAQELASAKPEQAHIDNTNQLDKSNPIDSASDLISNFTGATLADATSVAITEKQEIKGTNGQCRGRNGEWMRPSMPNSNVNTFKKCYEECKNTSGCKGFDYQISKKDYSCRMFTRPCEYQCPENSEKKICDSDYENSRLLNL